MEKIALVKFLFSEKILFSFQKNFESQFDFKQFDLFWQITHEIRLDHPKNEHTRTQPNMLIGV